MQFRNWREWLGLGGAYGFLAGVIAIPPILGLHAPFTAIPDNDTVYAAQALLFNANLPQTYFDHTGYLFSLLLAGWLKLSHSLGFIPLGGMQTLFLSQEPFGKLFQPIAVSGRLFLILQAILMVFTFSYGVFLLTKDKILAFLAGFLLASTPGLWVHSLGLRAELLSTYFFLLALIALIVALQKNGFSQIILFFFCGLFAYLAVLAKFQIVLGILALPGLALVFGKPILLRKKTFILVNRHFSKTTLIALILLSSAFSFFFLHDTFSVFVENQIKGYQWLIGGYFLFFWILFYRFYLQSFLYTLVLATTLGAGGSLGYYFNFFHYNLRNHERILYFLDSSQDYLSDSARNSMVEALWEGVVQTVYNKIPWGLWGPQENFSGVTPFLFVAALLVCLYLLKAQKWQPFLQTGCLIGLSFSLESIFHIRYYSILYYIYVEPLAILALIWGYHTLKSARGENWTKLLPGIQIGIVVLAGAYFLDNSRHLNENFFYGYKLLEDPRHFCRMASFTPPLAEFIHHTDLEFCKEFILKGMEE